MSDHRHRRLLRARRERPRGRTAEKRDERAPGFETSGKTERRSAAESQLAQSSSASRVIAARRIFHLEAIRRAAGTAGGIFALQFTCGIFVTLGKCFRLITLLGDFPVRMSQSEHAGACAWASRQLYEGHTTTAAPILTAAAPSNCLQG